MTLISVIMSSFNHDKYLTAAIESVINQIVSDIELIIVDDCSTDNSKQIIKKYSQLDNRIKSIFHDTNQGVATSLNDGLKVACGKYVAFIDSDDDWNINKLEEQLKILNSNEDLIVWTEGELINQNGKPLDIKFTQRQNATKKKKSGNLFYELIQNNFIFKSSVIFKRENLKNRRFNENLRILDDFVFMVMLAKDYDFYFIKKPLTKYRIHQSNISSKSKSLLEELVSVYRYFIKKYDSNLPRHIKYNLLTKIIDGLIVLDEKFEVMRFLIKAFRIYPLKVLKRIF